MTKTYDTRSRAEILSAAHFGPYRAAPRLDEIGLRELRTLDKFFRFAQARAIAVPTVSDFLAFAEGDASPRQLENLRTAFDRLVPAGTPVCCTIRDAIREKKGTGRSCDRRDRQALAADPLMAPYCNLKGFEEVALEDLRVFARFLAFTAARGITVPTVDDYLAFGADVASSRRLRSLKAAIDALMPGSPAAHVILSEAIARKEPPKPAKAGSVLRPAAQRRVALDALPPAWRAKLSAWRTGFVALHEAVPAPSVIDNTEDILREYAKVQIDAGAPVAITIEGVRRMEASRTAHAKTRQAPAYTSQGDRPATRHTAVMRLRKFGDALGIDRLTLEAIRTHENALRADLQSVVPLKFGRYEQLPDLKETWQLAHALLEQSAEVKRRPTKIRLLNEAFCIAFWTLIPLRLGDGQLIWGKDIWYDGDCYRIDITTTKEDEPLRGRLHKRLEPFVDAVLLRGMNVDHLAHLHPLSQTEQVPVLRDVSGKGLADGYPSSAWRRHMGTGAHIARTRIHTELGQLGPEGVEMALALTAQRDARSQFAYQAAQFERAQRAKGQSMIDGLLAEVFDA
ncbi:hypothetical protein [Sulfitobacter sp. 1A12779]|uniref:hypothetical protein n=1 Tax=Sulfitobacter sp. 1A12779 TaxID=3368599 RepID=UPI003745528F